jgi:hypothetical protein
MKINHSARKMRSILPSEQHELESALAQLAKERKAKYED